MKLIKDKALKELYIKRYKINEIFTAPIEKISELVEFSRLDLICIEGNKLEYLYILISGKAKTFTTLDNGRRLLLNFFEDYGIIGDIEYLTNDPCNMTVKAMTPIVRCIRISFRDLKATSYDDPVFLRYIGRNIVNSLKISNKNGSKNLLYPLKNRLANYLYFSAVDDSFSGNLTELSELLATSYRHLQRTLFNLCLEGVLVKSNNGFKIVNKNELKKLANVTMGSYMK